MITNRRPNSRLISDNLIEEITKGVWEQNHYALIGSRFIGKSIILNEVKKALDDKVKKGYLHIVDISGLDFGYISTQDFIENMANFLQISFPVNYQKKKTRLSEILRQMLEKRISKNPIRILFIIKEILGLPTHIARELLSALSVCHYSDKYNKYVTSIVSGRSDLINLVQGRYSPYRFAKQYSIEGLEKKFSLNFIRNKLSNLTISDETFNYLYKETNGLTFLIVDLCAAYTREDFGYKNNLDPQDYWDIKKSIKILKTFEEKFMENNLKLSIIMRDIERRPDDFKKFLEILNKGNGKIELKAEIPTDMYGKPQLEGRDISQPIEPIPYLVASGAVILDKNRKAYISSPLLKRFFKKKYAHRRIADVYANHYIWDKAWKRYEKCNLDEKHRPVSGEDRLRLYEILKDWENSMHSKAIEGVDSLIDHFFEGSEHLLVFNRGGIWNLSNESPKLLRNGKSFFGDKIDEKDIVDKYNRFKLDSSSCIILDDDRLKIYSFIPEHSPSIPPIIIRIQRDIPDREIDPACFDVIKRCLEEFHIALKNALEIEYKSNIGELREKHLKVINHLNSLLIKDPFDMKEIVDETANALIEKGGYYRVLICLIDSKKEKVEAVTGKCIDGLKNFNYKTNFSLIEKDLPEDEKKWDIQVWVAKKGESVIVPDVTAERLTGPSTQRKKVKKIGMKAITVVPMKIGTDVIGTIHFERGDKEVPSEDELNLFKILAGEVAIIFRQAQRLTFLQSALHALDDEVWIINPNKQILFLNEKSCKGKDSPGWQIKFQDCHEWRTCYNANIKCLKDDVDKTGDEAQHYLTDDKKEKPVATDWLMAPIYDFRKDLKDPFKANGRIGYVERLHDISGLYQLLIYLQNWLKVKGLRATAEEIVKTFKEKRDYKWCRLFLYKKDNGIEFLESFAECGLKNEENKSRFQQGRIRYERSTASQPWHPILEAQEPAIYELKMGITKEVEEAESIYGFPRYYTKKLDDDDILEKEDKQWIEAPLFIGESIIGLLSLSLPDDFPSPRHWELMRIAVQGVAVALNDAIRSEEGEKFKEKIWKKTAYEAIHQFTNKLTSIPSWLSYAKEDIVQQNYQSSTDHIDRAYQRFDETMEIIKDFKRFASDKPFEDIQTYLVSYILHQIHKELTFRYSNIGSITLNNKIPNVFISISYKAMIEIFEILINNSIMHSQKSENDLAISINADLYNPIDQANLFLTNYIRIRYQDNGVGIPDIQKNEIFGPFYSTSEKGDGLGLTIAKSYIQRQGGEIREEGEYQKGACFSLYIHYFREDKKK